MKPTLVRSGDERRLAMYRTELAERAALLQRLGHSAEQATARLRANLAWDFDGPGAGTRPESLGDEAIAEIVRLAYARRRAR
jgi:hypothetical protein